MCIQSSPSGIFDNVVEVGLGGVGLDDEVRAQRVDDGAGAVVVRAQRVDDGAGAVVDLHRHLQICNLTN